MTITTEGQARIERAVEHVTALTVRGYSLTDTERALLMLHAQYVEERKGRRTADEYADALTDLVKYGARWALEDDTLALYATITLDDEASQRLANIYELVVELFEARGARFAPDGCAVCGSTKPNAECVECRGGGE